MTADRTPDRFLLAAAFTDLLAALLHYACPLIGAEAYRWLGAGDGMVQLAERGHAYPTVMAVTIGTLLLVWALYALSGAGAIRRLPLLRTALAAIAAVCLLRAFGFYWLQPYFPGNGLTFWLVSSAVCLVLGLLHGIGLYRVWPRLRPGAAGAQRR